ncbi:tetratricopeptide repeat protein [Streptomyces sp. NPDC050610]|uniref:tetratricopeptide repeat protein n=1 Tax=Streptomyces sp. NPDC050610 TaxID=3157097 RepID=UPI0034184D4A
MAPRDAPASAASTAAASRPNTAFRRLRGRRSPAEFAAAVRRAAREIGEQVSCDARYVGRVESGAIRCPNYAYERVFRHMFPGLSLTEMGFSPREAVRGRAPRPGAGRAPDPTDAPPPLATPGPPTAHDVLRHAFLTGGTGSASVPAPAPVAAHRVGEPEASAVEAAVRRIRLLDDRHGADVLYRRAAQPLRAAYGLLDRGTGRRPLADRLYSGAGELAISVGWLAHDSGRFADARSLYSEALAIARVADDPALEAHAFANTAFLARDAGRPREAVRAAQAAQRAARQLASPRLLSLLTLREAGGWAGLGDRRGCEEALWRAQRLYGRGVRDADPEWMSFFGEAELAGLEAQCWSALGVWPRAAEQARRAVAAQDPHFTRNIALFTAELAGDLAGCGALEEAASAGGRVLDLLEGVQSARIRAMLAGMAGTLRPHRRSAPVAAFLARHDAAARSS